LDTVITAAARLEYKGEAWRRVHEEGNGRQTALGFKQKTLQRRYRLMDRMLTKSQKASEADLGSVE
jgi:hypothetical protein